MTTIPTIELADKVEAILTPILGEQKVRLLNEDGDIHIGLMINAVPMQMCIEPLGDSDAVVAGVTVLGGHIEDLDEAQAWVAEHNRRIRFGHVVLIQDAVIFFHRLFSSSVNEPSIRHLINILLAEAMSRPDLAEKTGALSVADMAALDDFDD